MQRQRDELDQILNHPETAKRLVSVHSRSAVKAVIEHLQLAPIPGAVLHWLTGTPQQARTAADQGAWFSVNARMIRKTELLDALPKDRILLETDAPHTGKTSRPANSKPPSKVSPRPGASALQPPKTPSSAAKTG